MTDLEIVSLIALAVMTLMYDRERRRAVYLSCMLVAVGLKEATVEVDTEDKTFSVKHIKPSK